MNPLFLNLLAALSYVTGGVCMKLSVGLTHPWPSLALFTFFLTGAGLQAVAMRRAEMGVAYILVLGLEAVLALLVGILFFKESSSPWKLMGAALVVVGMILLHSGWKR